MELLPLVCLCLLSCSGDAVRVVVEQDSDAVLPCSLSTKEDISYQFFDWRKDGQKEVFMYDAGIHYNNDLPGQDDQFKSRVSFFQDQLENGNASIKITRTKMADSGNYSCDFPRHQPSQTFIIELVVGAASKPYVRTVITDKGVMLQCEVLGASPKPRVEWKDSFGNILQAEEPQVTERGGIVLRAAVTKTDTFRCVVTQEEISHQIYAETYASVSDPVLKDRTGENIPGASKPSVRTIKTDDGMVLQCEVLGASPKPKVEWKDSSGNVLQTEEPQVTESGGGYDIVLRAAVTKTDTFRCVVTQEEINHQIYAETYASVSVPPPEPGSNTGWIITVVVLILLLVGGGLYIKHLRKENRKKDSRRNRRNRANRRSTRRSVRTTLSLR